MTIPRIASVTAELFHTQLHNPFVTSQGVANEALGVAALLTLEDGRTARGELVPVKYVTGETCEMVMETIQRAGAALVGVDVTRWRQALTLIAEQAPDAPSARCGLEMAVFVAWEQATGSHLWKLLGGATESVESDVTIPILPNAQELTEIAWGLGINVFKIKVGAKDVEEDHARVQAVRQAAPEARLRIDANQAFTPEQAVAFIERVVSEGANVELLEQPVAKEDIDGMIYVAQRSPVPVFADESCRTTADALRMAQTPIQGYNLKINKSGIGEVLDIIAIGKAAGKKLMLGCMLETRRSIAISLAVACGTGAFDYLDLDSHLLLAEDGINPYFDQVGGNITLRVE